LFLVFFFLGMLAAGVHNVYERMARRIDVRKRDKRIRELEKELTELKAKVHELKPPPSPPEPIPEPETPDLEAKLAGLQSPRGWGLFLIKNMVDDMNIEADEVHHTIELIFNLEGNQS